LISLLLPRYYSSSTWGVVGRSTLAGNGLSEAWFVGIYPYIHISIYLYSTRQTRVEVCRRKKGV
jgi:hypothetical protein